MKKMYSVWIFCVFGITIIYGGISDKKFTVSTTKCEEILFCFNGYNHDLNFEFTNYISDKNYFYVIDKKLEHSVPISLVNLEHKIKKELATTNTQEDHIKLLLARKRLQYQLYAVNILGQLTNPINIATNYHKSLPPRMEGLGVRIRF